MPNRIRDTWLGAALALVVGTGLVLGCGSKSTEASGETHFVKCKTTAECVSLGADYSCQGGECKPSDGGVPGTDGGAQCAPGCTPAYGYPNDDARDCVDVSKKQLLGCFCAADQNPAFCRQRISDGTKWWGPITSLTRPTEFQDCPAQGPGLLSMHACDFQSCTTPPPSWCSHEDTCNALGCGGLEFDSNGCSRASCTGDTDCGSTDRCVALTCSNTSACAYDGTGACQCGGPDICKFGNFCNSTAEYGPGGAWSVFEMDQGSGPCPPGSDCTSRYRLTPDGQLVMSKFGTPSTATVDATKLMEIQRLIDGPELRRDMRDGFQCGPPPTDVGWSFKLTLPSGTLQADVTGCILTGPDGNVAKELHDYLSGY